MPSSSSQRLSRYIWVDLPDPSSPSTAISRPGNLSSAKVFIACQRIKPTTVQDNVFQYPGNCPRGVPSTGEGHLGSVTVLPPRALGWISINIYKQNTINHTL